MSAYKQRINHLIGSPFEIGLAMGQVLGPRLQANIDRYTLERVPVDVSIDLEQWRSGALSWLHALPSRFLEEFEGLAQGAGVPLQRVAEWAYLEVVLDSRCSGAILTLDGRVWVARNNDTFAPGLWGYVTVREVTGRIPTISFGMEGDVFTPTGINREKLWLHYNYLPAGDAPVAGWPHLPGYALLVEALETCQTLHELEALLARIHRDDGMLIFAVEGKTGTFALYECSCTDYYKREPIQGWLVGTNHYCTFPKTPPPSRSDPLGTANRYARIETLVEQLVSRDVGTPPVEELIRILADDSIEAREGDIITAYSNVACPSTQEIWYTFGGYPSASRGDWHKLAWPW